MRIYAGFICFSELLRRGAGEGGGGGSWFERGSVYWGKFRVLVLLGLVQWSFLYARDNSLFFAVLLFFLEITRFFVVLLF